LEELYHERVETLGQRQASYRYLRDVFSLARPFILKRNSDFTTSSLYTAMFSHYLTVAFRQLSRQKAFSLINLLGLALGLTSSLLITLWVLDELRMDNYHANGPSLYRVMERQIYDGKRFIQPNVPGLMADELARQFPEVVYAAGAESSGPVNFQIGDKHYKEEGYWAGKDYFKMFSVPLLAGSAGKALDAPNSLVLSRRLAAKYFGSVGAAMGKTVRIDDEQVYTVSAVFEDLPASSSVRYEFVLPWQDYLRRNDWAREWGNNGPLAYVQLREGVELTAFQQKIKPVLRGLDKKADGKVYDVELFLQPYPETYLYSGQENGEISGGRIQYVRLFSGAALFLLLIAAINFMNLSTARSVQRAREVGIRKVAGAGRFQLMGQFMGEALLMTILALSLAGVGAWLLLPAFNQLTGKHITLSLAEVTTWPLLLGVTLLTALVAGSYPALFLSALQPVSVLKGTLKFKPGAKLFRQGLVVLQFGLSLLLIVGTIVVYRQVDMIQNKHIGFARENLLYVPLEGNVAAKYPTFRQELLQMSGIASVSWMSGKPHQLGSSTSGVTWPGKDESVQIEFTQAAVGYDLTSTLHLQLAAGRDFSMKFSTDSSAYLINEEAARRIGYQDPVGKPLTFWEKQGTIIGVIKNFHFRSLHDPMEPLVLRLVENTAWGYALVRPRPGQTRQALESLETLHQRMNPSFPFSYQFADEEYQRLYQSEQLVQQLAGYSAALALFIACLGLFGLAAFTAEQRTKEIGVRKVLGSSVGGIVLLLSKDFLKLVALSILIASPVAWLVMQNWLENFAYKIQVQWWMFAVAGGLVLLISLLTVSFQSIKAALINPVKSLHSE
jgi:predicted permease